MCGRRIATLWFCLAALPLIGCAAGVPAGSQQTSANSIGVAADWTPAGPYPSGAASPAAILVVLPGAGGLAGDQGLWTREGLAIVMPPPTTLYELAAAQEAALAQELASARRLADAPIWLLGSGPEIKAALAPPGSGREQLSGVVVTSSGAAGDICSESFSYVDPGTGAKPQVKFRRSGNCPPGPGFDIGGPTIVPAPAPALRPKSPRIIEAEIPATASPAAQRAAVARLAELIKAGPPS
jgi:hypothetical protein